MPHDDTPTSAGHGPHCLSAGELAALLDGELPAGRARAARRHVADCPACRAEATMWEELDHLCDAAAVPDDSPPPPLPGYRILSRIGRGGFGTVWLAEDEEMPGCRRAVKVLHPAAAPEDGIDALRDKAVLIDRLGPHRHRVRVYRVLSTPAGAAMVTEYVPGPDLAKLTAGRPAAGGPLVPWEDACRYLEHAADGLVGVHAAGLWHGDVTPRNLIWNPTTASVVVVDFGLAARSHGRRGGTPGYRAPDPVAGPAGDVFGLAAVGWHLLTGGPPPADPDDGRLPAGVPPELESLVRRGLRPTPTDRPTAAAFRDEVAVIPTGWLGAKLQDAVTRLGAPVRLGATIHLSGAAGEPAVTEFATAGSLVTPAERTPITVLTGRTGDLITVRGTASRDGFFTLLNLTTTGELVATPVPGPAARVVPAGRTAEASAVLARRPGRDYLARAWTAAPPAASPGDWRDRILAAWAAARAEPERTAEVVRTATGSQLSEWAAVLFVVPHREDA